MSIRKNASVLDVGCGIGFAVLPLATIVPDWKVCGDGIATKKLAQPVTIIIIGILYRSTIDRCDMGKCMSQDRASAGNLADELGRAFAVNNWHEDNTPTKGFDLCGTNYLVLSVVRALDKHIGLQSFDQI